LKFAKKLFWSHSWTRSKLAFYALGHEQFHEAAADIDDENSSVHERASARSGGDLIGRARIIAPRRPSVLALQLCCQASTLRFQALRTGAAVAGQISNQAADFLQSVGPTGHH